MRRSASKARRRRPTGVVLGVLILFVAGTIGLFVFTTRSDDNESGRNSRSAVSKTASTTAGTTTTTRGPIDYVVQRGDTLTGISKQFGVSAALILEANDVPYPDQLVEGQVLVIPPTPAVRLTVKPAKVHPGESVSLKLTGAQPEEYVTFEVSWPTGRFTGTQHSPSEVGTVMASYRPGLGDPPGAYNVVARGTSGTTAQASFTVEPADP